MSKKAPERIGSVLRVPLSQLHPHPQNPFAVRDDSAMQELKEVAAKVVRAPMPRSKRAAQFAMFDALKGLKEAIAEKERKKRARNDFNAANTLVFMPDQH